MERLIASIHQTPVFVNVAAIIFLLIIVVVAFKQIGVDEATLKRLDRRLHDRNISQEDYDALYFWHSLFLLVKIIGMLASASLIVVILHALR